MAILTCHADISECNTINLLLQKLKAEIPPLTTLGCVTFPCVRRECEKAVCNVQPYSCQHQASSPTSFLTLDICKNKHTIH